MENLSDNFRPEVLEPQVNWINELLAHFLHGNPQIKRELIKRLDACPVSLINEGIKRFTLEKWSGSESNPTVEIILVDKQIKFASTRYGMLSPLSALDCNKTPMKTVIMDFFTNPSDFFNRKPIV